MKILGYEVKKVKKDRKIVFYVSSDHIIDIKQEGEGWYYSDHDVLSKIYNQCTELVKKDYYGLNPSKIVELFNIFYSNFCEFIISEI